MHLNRTRTKTCFYWLLQCVRMQNGWNVRNHESKKSNGILQQIKCRLNHS
jgi:hypothetical protein